MRPLHARLLGDCPGLSDQCLRLLDIGPRRGKRKPIARRLGDDPTRITEEAPQIGDVAGDRVPARGRRLVVPDEVDDPIPADDVASVQRQGRQDGTASRALDRVSHPVAQDIDRAEESNDDQPRPSPGRQTLSLWFLRG